MSYYLGKVGRAGARLVSSCRDLYYDVNAAYLTGAVDIVVVKQPDGSLQSTPFHVRFGKLGVLRTGDWKEVEIEVNGAPVDLHMMIDESGQAFFTVPRSSESMDTGDDRVEQVALDMSKITISELQEGSLVGQGDDSSEVSAPKSPDNRSTLHHSQSSCLPAASDELMGLPMTVYRRRTRCHSDTLLLAAEQNDEIPDASFHITSSSSESQPMSLPPASQCIGMQHHCPRECEDLCCTLPDELEVLSDSAVDEEKRQMDKDVHYSALSDTEVEVKDRLSSKLWEWSDRSRKPSASRGEASGPMDTTDSAEEVKRREHKRANGVDRSGFWGALTGMLRRRKQRRFSSIEDGIYLDDIDGDSMDPEELSKFFPSSSIEGTLGAEQHGSSGLGSSPSPSPTPSSPNVVQDESQKLIHTLDDVCLSLCGGLNQGDITEEAFLASEVSFADFCSDPDLLSNPNLVVKVGGSYYNWQVAFPMIISAIVYLRPLPEASRSKLMRKYMAKKLKSRQSFWNFWGRGRNSIDGENIEEQEIEAKTKSEGGTPIGSPRKWMDGGSVGEVLSSDEDQPAQPPQPRPQRRSLRKKKYTFTTRPSSKQLESLPLRPGANEIVFSITTKFQGTTKAQCTLYLWNHSDKIVVSDIDGTITRSDVAGHVLPLFGKDWTQNGVVELFSSILRNGYRIIYLSARAIGQSWYTKEFLRNVRKSTTSLPDGPLFLAPISLYHAFRKEVIERKPEEFKIVCLEDIKALFSDQRHPFHAGFGNKLSDVKAYTSVGIPLSRIFTVNHRGNLKYELSWAFQSSYIHLMDFVDAQFPPIGSTQETKEDYSTFNFWREPVLNELPFELP